MKLMAAQRARYHQQGYLVVPALLPDTVIEAFLAFEAQSKPDGWRQHLRHHIDVPAWKGLATHPLITGVVEQLLQGLPEVVQTMYLEKQPAGDGAVGGRGVALHQDIHYLHCEPPTLMACWLALTDTDAENGGLCVVPGSHREGVCTTHRTGNTQEHDAWEMAYTMRDKAGKEWQETLYSFEIDGLDPNRVERLSVPRGGAVFFDGHTIHGSYANRSPDRIRRAFAIHYVRTNTWLYRTDVQDTMPV